jgi:hypothetical protein
MSRDLDWDGCMNARDLGGLPTADGETTALGAVVRADNARNLTHAGWQTAWDYGIRTVFDLRAAAESVADPPRHPDFAHAALSLFEHFDEDPVYRTDLIARVGDRGVAEQYRTLYVEALQLDARRFAEALSVVANAEPGGVLVHCTAGKDRTGLLAALFLRLAGVPIDVVDADYRRSAARLGRPDDAPRDVVDRVLATVEAEHGSTARYFLRGGASRADLDHARARLLGHQRQIA